MTNLCTYIQKECPFPRNKKCFTCNKNTTKEDILKKKEKTLNPEDAMKKFKKIDASGLSIGDCIEIFNEYIS